MNNLGKQGESIAKEYLENNGYKVLKTNYTTKLGEIDIIAKDEDRLVFIEVKLRQTARYGYPREAVNYKKQKTIQNVALYYTKIKGLKNQLLRFDVIEIIDNKINHIKNAF